MQDLLVEDSAVQEESKSEFNAVSPWAGSGPMFLLLAFAIFLFKTAPGYWPLTLTAFLGFGLIRLLEKRGLVLSLGALCTVMILAKLDLLWTVVLSASITVSWVLIYLGDQEAEAFAALEKQKKLEYEEARSALAKQLSVSKASLVEQQRQSVAHVDHLNGLYSQAQQQLAQFKSSLASLEKEYEGAENQCALLTQKLEAYRGQEILLKNAQDQIAALSMARKEDMDTKQEEDNSEEVPLEFKMLQHKYTALREQFTEKSQVLDQTRKELFRVENEFLCLQKLWEEKYREPSEEEEAFSRDLRALEQQRQEAQEEVVHLQGVISSLLAAKKEVLPRKRASKNEKTQTLVQKTLF